MSAAAYAGGAYIELSMEGADQVQRDLSDIEQDLKAFKKVAKILSDTYGVKIDVKDMETFTVQGKRAKEAAEHLQKELAKTGHSAQQLHILSAAADKAEKEMEQAGNAASRMGKKMARSSGDSGMGGLVKKFHKLHFAIRVVRNFTWAIGKLTGGMVMAAQSADRMMKASQGIGVSFESMQAMSFAAEQSGATQEDMIRTLQHMQRNLALATLKGGEFKEALDWVGMSAEDFSGLAPEEKFMKIADAVAHAADKGQALALAEKLMGEGARQMMPLLNQGSAGLQAYAQQAKELGLVLSTEAGGEIAKFMDTLNIAKRFFMSVMQRIAAAVAPVLQEAVLYFVAFTQTILGGNEGLSDWGDTAAVVTQLVVDALKLLLRVAQRVFSGFMTLWHGAKAGVALAAGMISRIIEGLSGTMSKFFKNIGFKEWSRNLEQIKDAAKLARETYQKEFNKEMDLSHMHGSDTFGTSFGRRLNERLDSLKDFMNMDFAPDGSIELKPSMDMKRVADKMDFKALEYGTEAFAKAQKVHMDRQIDLLASIDRKLSNPVVMGAF